jgi:hypothetical protein
MCLLDVCFHAIVCLTIASYLSRYYCATYMMCIAAAAIGGSAAVVSGSMCDMLIAIPSSNSLGENLSAGSIWWLRALMALLS